MRPQHFVVPEAVTVRPFLLKPQWMNGLSERLLVSHYVNHYGGAVQRLNAIRARLAALDLAHTPPFEINGLKREELTAAASVILHELYRSADMATIRRAAVRSRRPDSPRRSSAISAASWRGTQSSARWPKRWPAMQAGRCWCGLSAWVD
jgi:hypothetical protein